MKKYIKTNIIGFVIGGFIISGVAVYAAVTFPSNEVIYDNGTSGLESNNVQGAIDELYKTCTEKTPAGDQILENASLEKDPYECRYFFTGANPNNYVTFNGETAGWRIISVECDGTIKIMKNTSIGNMAWDSAGSDGIYDWVRPADLNTYLNGTYLSSLSSISQNQISSHDWAVGKVTYNNKNLQTQITAENKTIWNGKIALPTVSEYLRTNSNSNCKTYNSIMSNYSTCKNTNWMFNSTLNWWTLSPSANVTNYVFDSNIHGYVTYRPANSATEVRPAVYLSSELEITGGDGSQSNPYTLG